MNNRNASHKNRVIQFNKQSFRVVIDGRYLAGFRLLKAGLDIGLTDSEEEAYVYDSAQSAIATMQLLKISGKVEPVKI